MPTICTWARISGALLEVMKPPLARANLAMYEAAATMEGSSTTSGTSTSRPLTWKLLATAKGSSKVPMTFSIMPLAMSIGRAPALASRLTSPWLRPSSWPI
ncbi:hypothetical protein D3C81_1592490 [compost metagenome]